MDTIDGIRTEMIANNIEPFEPTHPGELLRDEIEYRKLSQKRLATEMGISYVILNDMVNCKRPISPKYALLFEAALGTPAHILTSMQSEYDMIVAKRTPSFLEKLKKIQAIAAAL